ncbi:porin family protein [Crenobacter caeni]|uniref:Porin family protein n=1 Tax=Crenobacter caeni TaxID=2705474 RepID=A0A6B2KNJ7_9NEIS|nr:porin family protein [Crenobacter caeni]NDV11559.1 porin family protein [Crenobacter caeni]
MKKLTSALLLTVLAAGAHAAQPDDEYIGIAGAIARHKTDFGVLGGNGSNQENTRAGIAINAGYYLMPQLSLELAYADLGDSKRNYGTNKLKTNFRSVSFSALGHLPVNDAFGVYGRLGASQARARATVNGESATQHDYRPVFGFGVESTLSSDWRVFAELTHYGKVDFEDAYGNKEASVEVMALQAGVSYHF